MAGNLSIYIIISTVCGGLQITKELMNNTFILFTEKQARFFFRNKRTDNEVHSTEQESWLLMT